MSHKNNECRMIPIAVTANGRILRCVGHPGYLLEYGPVIVRLRENELQSMANTVDELAGLSHEPCASCSDSDENCRGKNFALDICSPRIIVEFHREELNGLQELLIEARLSILLSDNQVTRADVASQD